MKSPSRGPSIDFAVLKKIVLHITGPRKNLEGCRLEKEGLFPMGCPGRRTESVSNMAHPFKLTLVHLKVWLMVSLYGNTLGLTSEWLEGILL